MSEKNEKRYEKEKRSTSVWLYLHLLLVFGLSLFVLYGSKEVSLYYLIGMWVIMIVYAWRTLVYIGIRRFLPCVVFALVIVYCILSLTFKVAQGEEESEAATEVVTSEYDQLLTEGRSFINQNMYEEAKGVLQRAAAMNNDDYRAYYQLGLNAFSQLSSGENEEKNRAKCEEAIQYFDKAVEKKSSYPNSYALRGVLYEMLGQDDKALKDFSNYLELIDENDSSTLTKQVITRVQRMSKTATEEVKSATSAEEGESASSTKEPAGDSWHHDFKNEVDISCSRKGCFSLYTYSFRGEGKKHTKEEIEKYHIQKNMLGVCYPSVKSECKIEWPEEESGLTPAALAKVRRAILWMAFPQTEPFSCLPYERLKGFGETPGSILKYLGMIDTNKWEYLDHYISDSIEDGYLSNSGNFSLSAFVLSSYMGKLPATEGDEVGDDCLRFSLDFAKQFANECYECKLENYHQCSQYTFDATVELSWPFGLKAKDGAKWYERPILCVNYSGYANDGGHGNHSMTMSKIYSLPDGEEQIFKDYFDSDKLEDLKAFVKQRVIRDWLENSEEGIKEMEAFGFYLDDILVSEEGMMFKWPPYAILPGSGGSPEVLIEWKDLEEFKK